VQASILADARMTGYSYVLSQAHQHVIIPADIAQTVQSRALACYWQALGYVVPVSAKINMKKA